MKLEELLGSELYAQVQAKIDEVNAKEPDKLKHIRYADLSEGEYVGRGKHEALQTKYDGQTAELEQANNLIAQLKKGTKGNDELQGKITDYEAQVQQLQQQLAETKLKSAIKVALLSEKAVDIDYLTFKLEEKLKEKGETLELDENDNIKGWDSQLAGLKTQFPTMFESGTKKIEPNKLPDGDSSKGITRSELLKKSYKERQELFEENPEAYHAAMES